MSNQAILPPDPPTNEAQGSAPNATEVPQSNGRTLRSAGKERVEASPEYQHVDYCLKRYGRCKDCSNKVIFCINCSCIGCSNVRLITSLFGPLHAGMVVKHCVNCYCDECNLEALVYCSACFCTDCQSGRKVDTETHDDNSGEFSEAPATPTPSGRDRLKRGWGDCSDGSSDVGSDECSDDNKANGPGSEDTPENAQAPSGSSAPKPRKTSAAQKSVAINCGVQLPPGTKNVCAITQYHSVSDMLQACHVVPRSLSNSQDLVRKYEAAWGMGPKTFYIHTSNNLLSLCPTLHQSFDAPHWALMPTDVELVQKMHMFSKGDLEGESITNIRELYRVGAKPGETETGEVRKSFEYLFVPFKSFTSVITRLTDDGLPNEEYVAPYADFPTVHSHILPHFMVYNFMEKYEEMTEEEQVSVKDWFTNNKGSLYRTFTHCEQLYATWNGEDSEDGESERSTTPTPNALRIF